MAHVLELEINGDVYSFKAGFAFIREIEPMKKQKQNGVEQDVGLNYILAGIYDGDPDALLTALDVMNKEQKPRLKKSEIEGYIEECEDVEGLFEKVLGFLSTANCTKKKVNKFLQMAKNLEADQEAKSRVGGNSTGNA